ncbi:MAG TPA: amino acid adenylation domain-containing protein [Pyrinomonadaceae bacterium]|nr:amino acid adenylation domain-containing protein [Pyrinomonadaceae bacterium]
MTTRDDVTARRSSLSPAKRELFERRVRGEFAGRAGAAAIRRRLQRNFVPLSFAQQRLWFLHQMEPRGFAYNLRRAVRVDGALDAAALHRTLEALVERHESLRTNFAVVDGRPVQVIGEGRPVGLTFIDLRERPDVRSEEEIEDLLRRESQRPFDLSKDLLLRPTLLRLGPDEHILLLASHQIVTDLWSNFILLRDFAALYEAFSEGRPSPLAELPIQYADFAVWQREWLTGEVLESQLSYWKRQLGEHPAPALELPADRPRPAVQTFRGERLYTTFPPPLLEGLKALGRREGATLFMTLLAAFQALLHRYTGRDDVTVGAPIANRNRPETEGVVGFFLNTLALRTDFSGDPSFCELLARVREVALGAYAHQDLPFEKLVEELRLDRDLSSHPLFNVVFNVPNASQPVFELPGLTLTPLEFDMRSAKFDLTLFMEEAPEGLRLYLEYNTDLFGAETIARMAGHLRTLLEAAAAEPSRRVSELPLLTEEERRRLLYGWNDTAAEYNGCALAHELFEAQAARTPSAAAVVCGGERLTYAELNRRANRLARYLRRQGAGPEVIVGVCMERSVGMLVALLGILKAGAAYLPLDPSYPEERLSFMLADARAPLVVTEERAAKNLPRTGARLVLLDAERDLIERESGDDPERAASAENLAYVIYTSGSTGEPKGVCLEHRNTAAFLDSALKTFTREQLAGTLAAASLSFDLSVFELFVPLSAGGRVTLIENILELSTPGAAEGLTMISAVPSAAAELLRAGAIPASVGTVSLGGEPLPACLVREVYGQRGVRRVFNLYGPTECTTYSTLALRTPDGPETIGRPVSNTQVYILDRHLQPSPTGVPGELYIGGAGVSRGYLGRPDLTAERFIPDPFGAAGGRLYRTGDLARRLPDGNIEFLGRLDQQVKVRGFRVEPGEVEAALGRHPGVAECAVAAREETAGDKRLVAYVVARGDGGPKAGELRAFLRRRLPEYMIPSAFVPLGELPRLPSGKLDRRALPRPERARPDGGGEFVAPRTPLEEGIARTWSSVLGVERIGVRDNFFELGGHSLLATQVVSRLRDEARVEVPLRSLFENPTVEGLAAAVARLRSEQAEGSEVADLLAELESLSKEDARRLLSDERSGE